MKTILVMLLTLICVQAQAQVFLPRGYHKSKSSNVVEERYVNDNSTFSMYPCSHDIDTDDPDTSRMQALQVAFGSDKYVQLNDGYYESTTQFKYKGKVYYKYTLLQPKTWFSYSFTTLLSEPIEFRTASSRWLLNQVRKSPKIGQFIVYGK